MGLKIVMQSHLSENSVDTEHPSMSVVREGLLRLSRKVLRPDTEVTMSYLDKHAGSVRYLYPAAVNTISLVNKVIQHEEAGYDAVVIPCTLDPALQECRATVKIPVISAGEASMLIAQLLGRKFALLIPSDQFIGLASTPLYQYGWRDRAIEHHPARGFEPSFDVFWDAIISALQGKPEKLIADFEKVALECVRDGADTIVCYEGPASTALSLVDYTKVADTGVPVVSAAVAMFKLAEIMADLKQSIGLTKTESLMSPYAPMPKDMLAQIQQDFKF
ncbi:aspartate/glutamate racemase family protein [Chloroflexota bacterium]